MNDDALDPELAGAGWRPEGDAIARTYRFADAAAATAWMAALAPTIKAMNHHPDWTHTGSEVAVRLTTHDAGRVTQKDLALARAMEAAASGAPWPPQGTTTRWQDRPVPKGWRAPKVLLNRDRGED